MLLVMSVHTFLEALALGFMDERAAFYSLFTAIASHQAMSAVALSARFLKDGASMKQVGSGGLCAIHGLNLGLDRPGEK